MQVRLALCIVLALLGAAVAWKPAGDANDILNVWVVAHSHDDTGWLLTVDDYYTNGVQYVFDTVVDQLSRDPTRKFIFVEVAFFYRWWQEQTPEIQTQVHTMVNNKQIEFILGGWCMNDEAVTNYEAEINQMTVGHEFLLSTFGIKPRVAWHIDPFGASAVTPELWSAAGFDAFIINRIDYRLKDDLKKQQGLEFMWQGTAARAHPSQLFTHILDSHYCTPDGFGFEHDQNDFWWLAGDNPSVTLVSPSPITPANIKERADLFVNVSLTRAAWFRTNNLLIPFGCDFQFQNAWMMYKNMDRLIKYINDNSAAYGVKVQYSTISDYIDAVRASYSMWPVRQYDFLPYADNDQAYWTGFYTSRPALKHQARQADATMRTGEALHVAATLSGKPYDARDAQQWLEVMRHATAVVQHHDGITGTEKQHVADDYAARLTLGTQQTNSVATRAAALLVAKQDPRSLSLSTSNDDLVSYLSGGMSAAVVVSNTLGWSRTEVIRLPVPVANINVTDSNGTSVPMQVNAVPYQGQPYTLYFRATVPALGFNTYFVSPAPQAHQAPANGAVQPVNVLGSATAISNEYVRVNFDTSGVLQSVTDLATQRTTQLTHEYMAYLPSVCDDQPSGAYIFRPNITGLQPLHVGAPKAVSLCEGPLVSELVQQYTWSGAVQSVRLYRGLSATRGGAVETEHVIGPIDISDGVGKEVMCKFSSDIPSGTTFYTDNNGLEMMQRERNLAGRPGDKDPGVALAGNFYPVVSRAYVTDGSRQLTLITPSTHAGSSLQPGELELMLHRRLLVDDARGVGEPLNETTIIDMPVWLVVSDPVSSAVSHRQLAVAQAFPLTTMFGFAPDPTTWTAQYNTVYSLVSGDLPPNVHVVSLKQRLDGTASTVLRLLHLFALNEHPVLSKPVQVDLAAFFAPHRIQSIQERSLTLNQAPPQQQSVRSDDVRHARPALHRAGDDNDGTVVELGPLDLRSFLLTFN